MFCPNVTPTFSHRDSEFKAIYSDFKNVIRNIFSLSSRDDVIYVTGSGTLANEIVLSSLRDNARVITSGGFSRRISETLSHHKKLSLDSSISVAVQYETGMSVYNHTPNATIVDGVSALPYYDLTGNVITTVLSKQFGLDTGTSVIIIRDYDKIENIFRDSEPSYLSLKKYIEYGNDFQTPNTPNMGSIISAIANLRHFDVASHRARLDSRIRELSYELCRADIHHVPGIVTTLHYDDRGRVRKLVDKFSLYTRSGNPQLFLWSSTDYEFTIFIKELSNV